LEEVLARVQAHLSLRRLQRALQEANRRMEQELALAGAIQRSLLPAALPTAPGWQFAALLKPARETSGDFYDIIPLPDGRIGLLVADVVDKGVKAALFMALSWALIRTYVCEYPAQPALALAAINNRILHDTRSEQFLSLFYGILDPTVGALTYCNAGHNPPLLWRTGQGEAQILTRTGMLLGVLEDQTWGEAAVGMPPGASLILYTDGVTDSENGAGDFFGMERLRSAVQATVGQPAPAVQDALINAIHRFTGDAAQFDDMALLVATRSG
jgi:serine phosphatase RsbU (regulator of sigma subunit)